MTLSPCTTETSLHFPRMGNKACAIYPRFHRAFHWMLVFFVSFFDSFEGEVPGRWIIVQVLDYWSFLFSSFYFLGIDIPKGILFFHLILVLDIWILVLTFPARTRVSSFSSDSALRRAKCQTHDGLLSESKCEIEKEILSNFETKFSPLKEDR